MIDLNKNLDFYKSYFHGFQDLVEHKSVKQVIVGAGKILSGFTFIVPIIFGLGYLIAKNELNGLESLYARVSKNLNTINSEKPSQNDLITFLSTIVLDKNPEKHIFELAFKNLDSRSQRIFFDSMSDQKILANSLEYIPQDIREINIGFGFAPSEEVIEKVVTQLQVFKQLRTITFDLSQTTHLTRGVKNLFKLGVKIIHLKTQFKRFDVDFNLNRDYVQNNGLSTHNNALPASRLIRGVVYHLIKESKLAKINFCFKQDGQLNSAFFINPSRLGKISEEDLEGGPQNDPLNNFRPISKAKDIWLAYVGSNVYTP